VESAIKDKKSSRAKRAKRKNSSWQPDLFQCVPYEQWEEIGKMEFSQKANKKVLDILESYEPDPLPQDVQNKIHEIAINARERIVGA
jgi:trimethylamine:corrinoid methyltransferase-like protein